MNTDMGSLVYTSNVTVRNGETLGCGVIGCVATTARALAGK